MKAATLKELRTELTILFPAQVLELCLRMAKYKKENKELLTYLLFEAKNEQSYINEVKKLIDEQFEGMNKTNLYLSKKTIRKALRTTNKFIKYSGSKQTEVELLIFFCKKIRRSGISLNANTAMGNLYTRQVRKMTKALATLHEDLQYDYSGEVKSLQS